MRKKPIIAITLDYHTNTNGFYYSERPWYALRCDYSSAISSSGGIPIFISHESSLIGDILSIASGLIISGGDYHIPSYFYNNRPLRKLATEEQVQGVYGAQNRSVLNVHEDSSTVATSQLPSVVESTERSDIDATKNSCSDLYGEKRAKYETELATKAVAMNIPIIGICNGMQVLNVALGGTLETNIPNHKQPSPKNVPYHQINIVSGTKLSDISNGSKTAMVNSTHSQGLKDVADCLVISATAQDGVIEAVEHKEKDFVIGVQWHPEYKNEDLDRNLLMRFINIASR